MITDKHVLEAIEKIEENDFSVTVDDNIVSIQKYSPCGRDFSFDIDTENDVYCFLNNILECMIGFDVSYETYIYLDNTGHGTNGAPYDMSDLYDDTETCYGYIEDVYGIVGNYTAGLQKSA